MTTMLGSGIEIFLHPGEWYFADEHTRIRTTLGSCIAVTVWHPVRRIGGMCHYMLPDTKHPRDTLSGRYGSDAVQLLVAEIHRHGGHPVEYEAKLFGGASMFDVGPLGGSVANRNIRAAEGFMTRYGLRVVARSLGGCGYRQVLFNIADGDVWIRQGGHPQDSRLSGQGGAA